MVIFNQRDYTGETNLNKMKDRTIKEITELAKKEFLRLQGLGFSNAEILAYSLFLHNLVTFQTITQAIEEMNKIKEEYKNFLRR